ncbi:MAG: hypothetical protein K6C12_12180 [Oscillospiraceae bacterium]|nr:hypothetical protein [Oscillospiraceae bacterium]
MKSIKKAETFCLCSILAGGFLCVLLIIGSWFCRIHGFSNVLVDLFSRNASPDFGWVTVLRGEEGKYARPKSAVEKYESVAAGLKSTIENFCTTSFPGSGVMKRLSDVYRQDVMRSTLSAVVGGKTNQEYAEEAFKEVSRFSEWLDSENIPFLYVQFPFETRIRSYVSNAPYPAADLDTWDRFSSMMSASGIPFLNFNDQTVLLRDISLDDSGHWMSDDALHAAAFLAEMLNRDYGYHFDLSLFDISRYTDVISSHPEIRERIEKDFGYTYEFLVPVSSPQYIVEHDESEVVSGDFSEVFLKPVSAWDSRNGSRQAGAYHDTLIFRNGVLSDIHNLSGTNHKGNRILVLGDSYSWPVVAYLSQDLDEIALLHPRYFNGDVRTYISHFQPDLVVWMYVEAQVSVFNSETFGLVN